MAHRLLVGGELVLYGDVGDMWGDGSGFTGRDVLDALAEHGKGPITVRLNSGGGFVADGVAIYNALRAHDGDVTVSVDAIAASAASVIAMAGSKTIMREGALLMIHDPSGVTIGTAKDHQDTADVLDKLGGIIAGIYAETTGIDEAEMRAMMLAETWLDAEEAVEFGFATDRDQTKAVATAPFDYALYSKTPETLMQEAFRARPVVPVAVATNRKEPVMAANEPGATPAATVAPVVANHADEIFARCESAKLTMGETAIVMKAACGDLDKGRDAIIAALAARDSQPEIRPVATVTADARDRFKEGVSRSLLFKARIEGGEVNEFSSMTLREIARESLAVRGVKMSFSDPMAMVSAAFSMSQHSTSDFDDVLANVANKSLLKGYLEAEETFTRWTSVGNLPDFKSAKRVDLNLAPTPAEVPEGAEYTYATIGDRGETIQLATYGKMFAITRQAIINDDMSVFTRVPERMGRAARRKIGDLVYAILTGNPTMADSVALFDATHANTTTGTLTTANLDAARAKMSRQTDPDSHATGGLNIRPAFLIVPSTLEGKARQLVTSEFEVTTAGTSKLPNYVRNLVEVVADARLDTDSTAEWYLAASPTMHDTIEVAYLNGNSNPTLERQDGWNVDGVEYKVRIDAAAKALDHRGLVYSTGA